MDTFQNRASVCLFQVLFVIWFKCPTEEKRKGGKTCHCFVVRELSVFSSITLKIILSLSFHSYFVHIIQKALYKYHLFIACGGFVCMYMYVDIYIMCVYIVY